MRDKVKERREEIMILKEFVSKLIPRRRLGYMKKKMVIEEGVKIRMGGELLGILIVLWTTFV